MRQIAERSEPFPVGGLIGTVHRFGEIETVVALGNELRVQIGDLAL